MSQPKYLQRPAKNGNIEVFAYSEFLAARGDMKPYDGPLPGVNVTAAAVVAAPDATSPATPAAAGSDTTTDYAKQAKDETLTREARILSAVKSIPVTAYGNPAAGRPAMPRVGDVRTACDIKEVTVEEVLAAVEIINQK